MAIATKTTKRLKKVLPDVVQIGPLTFEIQREHVLGACAEILYTEGIIKVSPDLSADVTAVSYWHEVFHGMLFQAGYNAKSNKHDEIIIDALAHAMVMLLRECPDCAEVC
jgi:hypothetical protein